MVQFRNQEKEIVFKVVYYGPALGGKTTNLETLHKITDPEGKSKLTSLKTSEDRTLFFDLLPFDLGEIQGYKIRVQVYTVPGQVHYNTTRRIVLSGADSIVFVADSQTERLEENRVSWENMRANLIANKMKIETLPVIIQCNKIDLKNIATKEEIISKMGLSGNEFDVVLSSAIRGDGVVETFRKIVCKSLSDFANRFKLSQKGVTSQKLEESVNKFFEPYESKKLIVEEKEKEIVEAKLPVKGLSEEEQLVAALQSSTKLAEQFGEVERLKNLYEEKVKEMTFLLNLGKEFDKIVEHREIALLVINSLSKFKQDFNYTLLKWEGRSLERTKTIGFDEDPFFKEKSVLLGFLTSILNKKERFYIDDIGERVQKLTGKVVELPKSLYVLFLFEFDSTFYTLLVYPKGDGVISKEIQTFLSLLGEIVTSRSQSLKMLKEVERTNYELERKVLERTAEISNALEEIKEVDKLKKAFLNSVSHEIKTPLSNIKAHSDFLLRHPEMLIEKGNDYLKLIRDESMKLEELFSSILSFSFVKEKFRGETTNLCEVLNYVLGNLSKKIKEKKIQIEVKTDSEKIVYPINREDAQVVMEQLIDNAIKFSPKEGKVKIFLLDEERRVIFSVRDFGCGFSHEKKQLLYEPLTEKSDEVLFFKEKGLGLGLFFVREVVSKYKGSFHIDNMEVGTNILVEFSKG